MTKPDNSWANLWGPRWMGHLWVVIGAGVLACAAVVHLVLTVVRSHHSWGDLLSAGIQIVFPVCLFFAALAVWRLRRRSGRSDATI